MAENTRRERNTSVGFNLFYEENVDVVYRFLRVRSSAEQAEDLTAEVFASAYSFWRDGGRVETGWLMTVARRRLIDEWRSQSRSTNRQRKIAAEQHRRCRSFGVVESDTKLFVLSILDRLPPTQRQALVLRYLDDQPVGAVADTLGRSYGAAESLLARARSNFGRVYDQQTGEGVEADDLQARSSCDPLSAVA